MNARRLIALSARNVGRNRRRSTITGVAIVFGVTAVVLLRGFSAGAARLLTEDVVNGRTGALQVHRVGAVGNLDSSPLSFEMPYDEALLARIRSVPGVRAVTGRIQFNGLVGNGISQTMVIGRGVDLASESRVCPNLTALVTEGGPLTPGNTVQLGDELGRSFGLQPGKSVTVQAASAEGRSNALDLSITGLAASTLPLENKRVLTLPLDVAQSLVGLEGRVTELAIAVHDLDRLDETADALRAVLGPDYEVHDWSALQPFVRDIINRQNALLAIFSVVLFIVVIAGIANTMLMSVYERTREIGTMLALGMRRHQIVGLFLWESALIGVTGGAIGSVTAWLVLHGLAWRGLAMHLASTSGVQLLRPQAPVSFIAFTVSVAFAGAVVACLWPAFRASRLNPVDALRNS